MRTSIYVDGFNLYFGALKNTPHKWLDIKALCQALLNEENQITQIKYFTAHVSATQSDPDKAVHQQLYIRALRRTTPEVEVITGQFRTHQVMKKLVAPIGNTRHVLVQDRTEKGSDVNLAVHLVNDSWLDKFDCAVVISGDSDLAEAIKLVRLHHKKKVVGVFSPGKRSMSKEMANAANFVRAITTGVLAGSQMPSHIPGSNIFKPTDW